MEKESDIENVLENDYFQRLLNCGCFSSGYRLTKVLVTVIPVLLTLST